MAIKLPPDFKEFLRLLNAHGVEYLIIGGYAVGYHGYPRATQDPDIWISTAPENADRVVAVVREFEFDVPQLSAALIQKENNIIRFGIPPVRIGTFPHASGVRFDECYRSRAGDTVDEVQVNVIGIRDLFINKKATGRYKDLADLEELPEP